MAVTTAEAAGHLRRLAAERACLAEQRAVRLLSPVPAAALLLRGRYGAREVLLFGSLAAGTWTDSISWMPCLRRLQRRSPV
jgi:hypothetical protein